MSNEHDDYAREVRAIFGHKHDEPEASQPARRGNLAPREGGNPRPPDPDGDMRTLTRAIFTGHLNA